MPTLIKRKSARENILKNNHKHGSRSKGLNKNVETSSSGPTPATFVLNKHKLNPVHFFDPYDHINPMDNNNYRTHLVDANEEHTREDYEEEEVFDDATEDFF